MPYIRLDPFWHNGARAKANLASLGRVAYGRRVAETTTRKDLLSFMLRAKDPDTGLPLPGDEVLAEAISFIVGGSDTTASTMASVVDFVSRDPALQKELYEKLCGIFPGPLDDGWVASDGLAGKCLLLNAVIKETLRLRPTSSTGLERITPAGGRSVAGDFYPENVSCHWSSTATYLISIPRPLSVCQRQRSSTIQVYSRYETYQLQGLSLNCRQSPEKFLPKRWLAEDASALNEWFIPFSVGPRACIGRK